MDIENFDIAIVGSGLASYTALLFLIEKEIHLEKKICIIFGENKSSKYPLNKSNLNYIKKFHKVIFEKKNFDEINRDFLNYSKQNKYNLIYLQNLGGLSKYWGGGFFPGKPFCKDSIINKFIIEKFKFIKTPDYNYFDINGLNNNSIEFLDNQVLTSPSDENQILNPGIEIEKLCKKNDIRFFRKVILEKVSYRNQSKFNLNLNKINIKAEFLLLGAGVIGTPKILYNSDLLPNKNITIKDHLLYRIPLIRLNKIFKLILPIQNLKFKKDCCISSLKQAFKFNLIKRNLFLGLYTLDHKKINFNRFIKYLIKREILIFSQIFVGHGLGEMKLNISLDYGIEKQKLIKFKGLSLKEWRVIFLFFLKNNLFPIPFKYRTQFGASYHTFGSLVDVKYKLNLPEGFKNKIHIIDSSVLKKIDSEPTSYRIIKNTVENVENFLEFLKIN